nr:MAG TPA: hypothetical protein [Siphoviridae sp. ctX2e5]
MLAITLVPAKSKAPPTTPPTRGTSLVKFTMPVVPALVIKRNPTFWLIFVSNEPGIFFTKLNVSLLPNCTPASRQIFDMEVPVRHR